MFEREKGYKTGNDIRLRILSETYQTREKIDSLPHSGSNIDMESVE